VKWGLPGGLLNRPWCAAGSQIFRADRITPRVPTSPRSTPGELPGGQVSSFVDARFKGSSGADTWPCDGKVELDLSAAEVVPFALDGVVEALGPDRCRLTPGAWSWIGLGAALARFDADLHVIGPPELRDVCSTLAERFSRSAHQDAPGVS